MASLGQKIRPVTSSAVLKAMHQDYLAVRARSHDPQTGTEEARWCERASDLVLSLVSMVPQARATETPLDLSFARAVDSIEDAITAEAVSDSGHGRRAAHLLREYLSQVPGYLSPQVRGGAPVAAEALAFHGNVVALVTALHAHHA